MSISPPPADGSGGAIVIQYSNGTATHRMRFHVAPFNSDATGTYVSPPASQETSVQATAGALISAVKVWWPAVWTLQLAAVYRMQNGSLVQNFAVQAPASQTGTNTNPDNGLPEQYMAYNFKTVNGSRMRFFLLQTPGWQYYAPQNFTSPYPTGNYGSVASYFTGNTTGVVGHDGSKATGPVRVVFGINKRIRRRRGWA